MKEIKRYTVCLLLNKDGSKVLLQIKDKTLYKGKLNGVGGKLENFEDAEAGALREILEETSIQASDIEKFTWIATLILPEQCDDRNADKIPELNFFAGIVKNESLAQKPETETEEINWYNIKNNIIDTKGLELAGDGNLEYLIKTAERMLFNR